MMRYWFLFYVKIIAVAIALMAPEELAALSPMEFPQNPSSSKSHYAVDCSKPFENHDAADLCEQRRMSSAAEEAAWWTKFAAIIGMFGFTGVLASLYFAWTATRAATEQVRVGRIALETTERAYVFSRRGEWRQVLNTETGLALGWNMNPVWENVGNTPTKNLRIYVARSILENEEQLDFKIDNVDALVPTRIAPGGTVRGGRLYFDMATIDEIVARKKRLYVWGWAEYSDVFDGTKRHRSEFCARWFLNGNPRKPDKFEQHNTFYHLHNGWDDEAGSPVTGLDGNFV